ncbi:MAG: HAD hydrolase-like protein [Anaerolineaceae bacterium]|nr:HAD hydrolase-like protein [Anaerolineaceae bacterium]
MPGFTFKNIIWDVDGTLFDTYPAISAAILAALAEQGAMIGREIVTKMAMTSLGNTLPELADRFKLDPEHLSIRFNFFLDGTPLGSQRPFPGVRSLLRRVIRNNGLNLISTHRGQDSLIPLLKYHRINSFFADKLTTSDGYPRKPDPAMFNELIARYHLKRTETLAIGDRDLDLEAGKAAGIQTALFGQAPIKTEPDLFISDYREFLRMVN